MLFLIIIGLMAAIALTSYHTSVVAGHRNLTSAMPQTITGMTSAPMKPPTTSTQKNGDE